MRGSLVCALIGGIGAIIVGSYLMVASGLLFGIMCEGGINGINCATPYSLLFSEFWGGVIVLCIGLASAALASGQLIVKLFRK